MGKRRGRRPAKWETTYTLAATTERLYEAFRYYPLRPEIDYCTHCITPQKAQLVYARPLRELTPGDLSSFAFQAMTTWGDLRDFKHFLPRILELAMGGVNAWPDLDIVASKLDYTCWRGWPKTEQQAIEDVLMTALLESLP